MPSRRRLERDRRPGRGGSAEEPLHAARMAEAATDSRLAARREPRRGTRFGCCRYWPSARTRSPVRSSRLSPNCQAPPMVMWTLPPSLLRTQRRPKRLLPHRLLTHHRLPSPTLVLQSVPGRSNQPGGHTDDSGLFRVPPTDSKIRWATQTREYPATGQAAAAPAADSTLQQEPMVRRLGR
jgi:hypothetical protein